MDTVSAKELHKKTNDNIESREDVSLLDSIVKNYYKNLCPEQNVTDVYSFFIEELEESLVRHTYKVCGYKKGLTQSVLGVTNRKLKSLLIKYELEKI